MRRASFQAASGQSPSTLIVQPLSADADFIRIASVEWQTVLLAGVIYAAFAAVVVWNDALGPVATFALLAVIVAWHSSLNHECVHGHPTRITWINTLIAGVPLSPHQPYVRYRDTHLSHHETEHLTAPGIDSESFYVDGADWQVMAAPRRLVRKAMMTLAGRLILGPGLYMATFMAEEARLIAKGDRDAARAWGVQAVLVGALFWALSHYGIAWWQYVVFAVYPGTAVVMVRSFLEHRPAAAQAERTAVVEGNAVWSLLFLNNNFHVVHHDRPGLPWYRIPAVYRAQRDRIWAENGGYVYASYGEVFRRYLLTPRDTPLHPGARRSSAAT